MVMMVVNDIFIFVIYASTQLFVIEEWVWFIIHIFDAERDEGVFLVCLLVTKLYSHVLLLQSILQCMQNMAGCVSSLNSKDDWWVYMKSQSGAMLVFMQTTAGYAFLQGHCQPFFIFIYISMCNVWIYPACRLENLVFLLLDCVMHMKISPKICMYSRARL